MQPGASPPRSSPPRRPVSQQRYAMRRLGVLAVLGLVVFGTIRGVAALTGDEGSGEGPQASTEPVGARSDGVGAGAAAAATTAPTTTAAPPTAPPTTEPPNEDSTDTGPPSADNPAEVLIVGDSDAGTFFPYLEQILDETGVVEADDDYVVSSGLARPDFHDWPQHLRDTLATSDPDIIVASFGGNDAQGLSTPEGDFVVGQATANNAEEWTAEYVNRVAEVMDIMAADGDRTVIWVGIPNALDQEFTERLRIQDQAVRQALEDYPDAIFVDTWEIFDGRNDGIAEMVIDPRDGKGKPVRAGDGFHLNVNGAEILAVKIAEKIEDVLAELGTDVDI